MRLTSLQSLWLPPQPLEPCRIGRCVHDGMLNVSVSNVVLNSKRSRGYQGSKPRQSGEESRPCPHRGGGISHRGSADHLVRLEEYARRNREAESLGSLEVDHQLELRRLLDGEVGG